MPLSFGAILGGLVTLIGTPPNIIVATYRGEVTGAPFGMFDFTPVGAATAFAGVAFVALIGWRLVPAAARKRAVSTELFDIEHYVAEARVPEDCAAIGKTLAEIDEATKEIDALVVALLRGTRRFRSSSGVPVQAGDTMIVEASPEELDKLVSALGLELGPSDSSDKTPLGAAGGALVEAVIAPGSGLESQTAGSQRRIGRHGFTLLAVARQGRPYRGRLKAFRFRVGDVLLLHGEAERVPDALAAFGWPSAA
jgi:di/tricarboxylate transporter